MKGRMILITGIIVVWIVVWIAVVSIGIFGYQRLTSVSLMPDLNSTEIIQGSVPIFGIQEISGRDLIIRGFVFANFLALLILCFQSKEYLKKRYYGAEFTLKREKNIGPDIKK